MARRHWWTQAVMHLQILLQIGQPRPKPFACGEGDGYGNGNGNGNGAGVGAGIAALLAGCSRLIAKTAGKAAGNSSVSH